MSSAINYKRRFAETQKEIFQAAVWKRTCQSIFGLEYPEKTWMGDREKYVVCKLDGLVDCI
jgi:hypothetical protein